MALSFFAASSGINLVRESVMTLKLLRKYPCPTWEKNQSVRRQAAAERKGKDMTLKELCGEELYAQVEEKLNEVNGKIADKKDHVRFADLSEGAYVAKEKFDAKVSELSGVKKQLEDANNEIQSYKDMDVDGIKKSVTDWEKKYEKDTAALKKQMEEQDYAHQKDMFFSGVKFSSNAAKVGMMAEFDKQKFQLKDGTFVGAEKWLEDQKTSDAASFVTEEQPGGGEYQINNDQTGQQALPNFATATSSGSGQSGDQMKPFNLGFRHVRGGQSETK